MTTLQKIKALLAVVIVLFVTAAIYISALVIERQDALNQVSRYNVAWLVSQAPGRWPSCRGPRCRATREC